MLILHGGFHLCQSPLIKFARSFRQSLCTPTQQPVRCQKYPSPVTLFLTTLSCRSLLDVQTLHVFRPRLPRMSSTRAHMAFFVTASFFTQYIDEPIPRRLTAPKNKQLSQKTERDNVSMQQGSPYFRIHDPPPELQIAVFEQLIESWDLKISTHQNSCRLVILRSINVGPSRPC